MDASTGEASTAPPVEVLAERVGGESANDHQSNENQLTATFAKYKMSSLKIFRLRFRKSSHMDSLAQQGQRFVIIVGNTPLTFTIAAKGRDFRPLQAQSL